MLFKNPFFWIVCIIGSVIWGIQGFKGGDEAVMKEGGASGAGIEIILGIIALVIVWIVVSGAIKVSTKVSQEIKTEKIKNRNKVERKSKEKKPESDQDNQQNLGMTGTAFFIDTKGHLITNFHVVANAGNRLKIFYEGEEFKTKIIAKDETLDLALLKTSVKSKNCIEISDKVIKKMVSLSSN